MPLTSEQAAEIFYGRLFEIAPAMKLLFRGDMKEQGKRLMTMLTVVINGLSNLEAVAGGKRARQTPRRIRRQGNRLCTSGQGVVVDA